MLPVKVHQIPKMFVALQMNRLDTFCFDNCAHKFYGRQFRTFNKVFLRRRRQVKPKANSRIHKEPMELLFV